MTPPKAKIEAVSNANNDEAPSGMVPIEARIESVLRDRVAKTQLPEMTERLTQIMVSESFSGPMPHPRHFAQYDATVPGAGDRLLTMVEDTVAHHREMDHKRLHAERFDRGLGMILGAGLFLTLIVSGLVCALYGLPWQFTALFLGTGAVGGVGLFIKGRNG